MKFGTPVLFVGLLSVGLAFASPKEILSEEKRLGNFIDNLINSTISKLLSSLADPFSFAGGHYNLTIGEISTGEADISNLIITGIKKILIKEIHSDILESKFNATVNVPQLSISTNYDANVVLVKLLSIYGNGKLGVDVENVVLNVSAKYVLSPFSLHDAIINFDVDKLHFDVRGLLNNDALSALVEEVLNDNVVDFIKNHHALIDKTLSAVVNSLFSKKNSTIALPEMDQKLAILKKEFKSLNLEQ